MTSADETIRRGVDDLAVFDVDVTPCSSAPPLREARVAIVTTAGLRSDGGRSWAIGDQTFTVLDAADRSVSLAHASPNFDRSGFAADLNVVYPVDRLEELAAQDVIGSVAARHLSFMGAQTDHTMTTLRLDTGPAAAQLLQDDHVDVVVLTPV
jgi:D-proline reductase (dithiol) PrdB